LASGKTTPAVDFFTLPHPGASGHRASQSRVGLGFAKIKLDRKRLVEIEENMRSIK